MTTVRLQLATVDLHADEVVERIGASEVLRACGWKTISGIPTMTVFTKGDVVAETLAAVRCAQSAGLTVRHVYEDRVNISDIARRVGNISREAVRKWTTEDTFPQARSAGSNERGSDLRWHWAEVVDWLNEHKSLDLDDDLPSNHQEAEINAMLAGIRDYTSEGFHFFLQTPSMPVKAEKYIRHAAVKVSSAGFVKVTATERVERQYA